MGRGRIEHPVVSSWRAGAGLAVSSTVGFFMGGLTATGAYALYPPARDHTWPIPALTVMSVLFVLGTYVVAARFDIVRAGDWFVFGYALALVLDASLVVTREVVDAVRVRGPQATGFKTAAIEGAERI